MANIQQKSDYDAWETIKERDKPTGPPIPPIEKRILKQLWKTKAPSKQKHFLWKAMSRALAVKDRLQSRGLQVNPTCGVCNGAVKSICHLLFNCLVAEEVRERSGIPLQSSGFSINSVMLNIHYLIDLSKKVFLEKKRRRVFPWLLWQLWKARNGLLFEDTRLSATTIVEKAFEDATIWLKINHHLPETEETSESHVTGTKWQKPVATILKCNITASWSSSSNRCGVAWLVRDQHGKTLFHGRRAFSFIQSLREAELTGIWWATESLTTMKLERIIFEASLEKAREVLLNPTLDPLLQDRISQIKIFLDRVGQWSMEHTSPSRNQAAILIAYSVTREQRFQSYIASKGPVWLEHLLNQEALN